MIGLDDSLLTIVDGCFVGLFIKAVVFYWSVVLSSSLITACFELSLFSFQLHSHNKKIPLLTAHSQQPTAHSCSTKYPHNVANEFTGGMKWEFPTRLPHKNLQSALCEEFGMLHCEQNFLHHQKKLFVCCMLNILFLIYWIEPWSGNDSWNHKWPMRIYEVYNNNTHCTHTLIVCKYKKGMTILYNICVM